MALPAPDLSPQQTMQLAPMEVDREAPAAVAADPEVATVAGEHERPAHVYDAVFGDATSLRAALAEQGYRMSASGAPVTVFVGCCGLSWPFIYYSAGAASNAQLGTSKHAETIKGAVPANQATARKIKAHMRTVHLHDPKFKVTAPQPRNRAKTPLVPTNIQREAPISPQAAAAGIAVPPTAAADVGLEGGAAADERSGIPTSAESDAAGPASSSGQAEPSANSNPWDGVQGGKPAWLLGQSYRKELSATMLTWIFSTLARQDEFMAAEGFPKMSVGGWPTHPSIAASNLAMISGYHDLQLAMVLVQPLRKPYFLLLSRHGGSAEALQACDAFFAALRAECLRRCMRDLQSEVIELKKTASLDFESTSQ